MSCSPACFRARSRPPRSWARHSRAASSSSPTATTARSTPANATVSRGTDFASSTAASSTIPTSRCLRAARVCAPSTPASAAQRQRSWTRIGAVRWSCSRTAVSSRPPAVSCSARRVWPTSPSGPSSSIRRTPRSRSSRAMPTVLPGRCIGTTTLRTSLPSRHVVTAALHLEGVSLELGRYDGARPTSRGRSTTGERWVVVGTERRGEDDAAARRGAVPAPVARARSTCSVTGSDGVDVRDARANASRSRRPRWQPHSNRACRRCEVVMTAKYAALAPWWHTYTDADRDRAVALLAHFHAEKLADHRVPDAVGGRASTRLAGPDVDERARHRAARRADRRPRRGRSRRARARSGDVGRRHFAPTARARDAPPRGGTARLHARARDEGCAACSRTDRCPRR